MARLDRGILSEPFMVVQAYAEWQQIAGDRERYVW